LTRNSKGDDHIVPQRKFTAKPKTGKGEDGQGRRSKGKGEEARAGAKKQGQGRRSKRRKEGRRGKDMVQNFQERMAGWPRV
jgi:hypothetical protein